MLNFLTREQILAFDDKLPTITIVPIPQWKTSVRVRVMSGKDRERFEAAMESTKSGKNLRALLASLTVCDEAGKLLFTEADLAALGEKSAPALHRIYLASVDLNKVTKSGVDELEKNSEAAT